MFQKVSQLDFQCQICGLESPPNNHFFKAHSVSQAAYYETYYPRFNLLTQEKIKFKDRNSYFSNDFTSKSQLAQFYKTLDLAAKKAYLEELILRRIKLKNIQYAPTQVELRSLICPSIVVYDKLFGGYNQLCQKLGLKVKFRLQNSNWGPPRPGTIICDTREQAIVKFNEPYQIQKLDYGDYKLEGYNDFVIERKGIGDFIQSFGGQVDRLAKEFERAARDNCFVLVLIEEPIDNFLNWNFPNYRLPAKSKVTPDYLFHNVRDICQEFSNVQFLFANSKDELKILIPQLLRFGGEYQKMDLQFLKDIGIL